MLPSVVASELEQVAADALSTAFHPTTAGIRCVRTAPQIPTAAHLQE